MAGQTITRQRLISDWARRHINDKYVQQSLKDGYRCRSAYKLLQIQEKYKLLEPGLTVMECGCAPGSWSQVAAKLINSGGLYDQDKLDGLLVGCDLLHVESVPGAILLSKRCPKICNLVMNLFWLIYKDNESFLRIFLATSVLLFLSLFFFEKFCKKETSTIDSDRTLRI